MDSRGAREGGTYLQNDNTCQVAEFVAHVEGVVLFGREGVAFFAQIGLEIVHRLVHSGALLLCQGPPLRVVW